MVRVRKIKRGYSKVKHLDEAGIAKLWKSLDCLTSTCLLTTSSVYKFAILSLAGSVPLPEHDGSPGLAVQSG
jgi:hypothetical protein